MFKARSVISFLVWSLLLLVGSSSAVSISPGFMFLSSLNSDTSSSSSTKVERVIDFWAYTRYDRCRKRSMSCGLLRSFCGRRDHRRTIPCGKRKKRLAGLASCRSSRRSSSRRLCAKGSAAISQQYRFANHSNEYLWTYLIVFDVVKIVEDIGAQSPAAADLSL